jgi:hypothetical protein
MCYNENELSPSQESADPPIDFAIDVSINFSIKSYNKLVQGDMHPIYPR